MKQETYKINFEFEENHWWFKGRRKIVFNLIEKTMMTTEGKTLLDNGCGTGITLKNIDDFALKIGIDTSEDALNYSKKRKLKYLIKGNTDALPLCENTVDCILMLDVLEHLTDEKKSLAEAYRVCKQGGIVVVTVPAYQFLWSGEDEASLHKRRYVILQLQKLIESSGFNITNISYFNFFLMPLIYIVILFNKIFNREALHKSDLNKIPNVLNLILEKISHLESIFLRMINLPFGASIICVATKE